MNEIRRIAIIFIALNVLVPASLIVYAVGIYPSTDDYQSSRSSYVKNHPIAATIGGEGNAITWFSSMQLALIGAVAYGNARLARGARRLRPGVATRPWVWLVFCLGFVFLALDEQFSYHEAVRDTLVSKDMLTGFEFIRGGDVGLYAMFGVGMIFVFFLFRELQIRTASVWLFVAALTLASMVIVFDSLKPTFLGKFGIERHIKSPIEEIVECWAQLGFLLAFLGVFHTRLRHLLSSPEPPPQTELEPCPVSSPQA